MGIPKITGFMIALVLIGLFAGIFTIFIASVNDNYNIGENGSNVQAYNKLTDISDITEEIQEATDIEEKSGILDIIGGYFSSGYKALKLTAKSFSVYSSVSNQALEDANLGEAGGLLKMALTAIIIILIFIGVIIATIVKKDL